MRILSLLVFGLTLISVTACHSLRTGTDAAARQAAAEQAAVLASAAREQAVAAAEVRAQIEAAARKAAAVEKAAAEAAAAEKAAAEAAAREAEARAAEEAAAGQEASASGTDHRVTEMAEPCLNLRTAPALSSTRLECLVPGSSVEVLDRQGEWSRIRLQKGSHGWMVSRFLEPIDD